MKKIIVLSLILSTFLCAAPKVLATVGGLKITTQDLQRKYDSLPAQYVSFYSSNEGKKKLLDQLIQEKLFYLEAKKKKYDKNAEVISAIQKMQEEIMVSYFLKEEMDKIVISDKDIEDYYKSHKSKFKKDAEVRASHILVKTEAEAKEIIQQLNNGSSFEQLAKSNSTCPSAKKGGDLNYFSKGQMVKPFEDAAFALDVGQITTVPVKTKFGWHVIKLTDKKPAVIKAYASVKGEIRSELLHKKQKEILDKLASRAKSKYRVSRNSSNLKNF